uniref:Uncharacterized protein n=1 Tax=Anopheles culicifacies TaxID=139723 RepID=A0A182MAG8_9DIPT
MHDTWKILVLMDEEELVSKTFEVEEYESFDVKVIPSTIPLEKHHGLNLKILSYYNHLKPATGLANMKLYLEEDILCQQEEFEMYDATQVELRYERLFEMDVDQQSNRTVMKESQITVHKRVEVLQQSGDKTHLLSAALRGCNRSGDKARRSNGELGSAVLARGNPFFVGGVGDPPIPPATIPGTTADGRPVAMPIPAAFGSPPGLYDCVVLDAPSGCTTGNASGLDERVGEAGSGDGLGVRASGDSGIWSADFRRFEGRPPAAAAE